MRAPRELFDAHAFHARTRRRAPHEGAVFTHEIAGGDEQARSLFAPERRVATHGGHASYDVVARGGSEDRAHHLACVRCSERREREARGAGAEDRRDRRVDRRTRDHRQVGARLAQGGDDLEARDVDGRQRVEDDPGGPLTEEIAQRGHQRGQGEDVALEHAGARLARVFGSRERTTQALERGERTRGGAEPQRACDPGGDARGLDELHGARAQRALEHHQRTARAHGARERLDERSRRRHQRWRREAIEAREARGATWMASIDRAGTHAALGDLACEEIGPGHTIAQRAIDEDLARLGARREEERVVERAADPHASVLPRGRERERDGEVVAVRLVE